MFRAFGPEFVFGDVYRVPVDKKISRTGIGLHQYPKFYHKVEAARERHDGTATKRRTRKSAFGIPFVRKYIGGHAAPPQLFIYGRAIIEHLGSPAHRQQLVTLLAMIRRKRNRLNHHVKLLKIHVPLRKPMLLRRKPRVHCGKPGGGRCRKYRRKSAYTAEYPKKFKQTITGVPRAHQMVVSKPVGKEENDLLGTCGVFQI